MKRFLEQRLAYVFGAPGAARDPSDLLRRNLIREPVTAQHENVVVVELHPIEIGDDFLFRTQSLEDDVAVLTLGRFFAVILPASISRWTND